jgi:HSP20 family protein
MNKPNNFPFNWDNTNNWSNLTTNPFTTWNVTPFTNNPVVNTMTNWMNYTPTTPAVNTYETSENYVFEIAAPGYDKESFEVAYSNNNNAYYTLTVKATENKTERPTNYSYREYNYTSFTREFNIPNNAETSETRAKYDNGILTILIPKTVSNNNYKTVKIS